ncbi:MAG: hypothetical protein ACK58T_13895, partial [Phycisphaerae bacterium]
MSQAYGCNKRASENHIPSLPLVPPTARAKNDPVHAPPGTSLSRSSFESTRSSLMRTLTLALAGSTLLLAS